MESKFNSFQQIDMDNSQTIMCYLKVLEKIELTLSNPNLTKEPRINDLYAKVFTKLEEEIEKIKGRTLIIDIAQIPTEMGIEKFNEYYKNSNVLFVDKSKE